MDDSYQPLIATPPDPGVPYPLAPGLFWIRMPLPIRLRIVNLWLLEAPDGSFTAIDTGFHTPEALEIWESLLARFRITRLICSHYHPDHCGLSGWLEQRAGLTPWMSGQEWLIHFFLSRMADEPFAAMQDGFYQRHGMPEAMRAPYLERGNPYRRGVGGAGAGRSFRLEAGDRLRLAGVEWEVLTGQGHSPEHLCFFTSSLGGHGPVFLAGDQVLPKITPNTSVFWFLEGADPLGDYIRSLDRLQALPGESLVLPGHREPFLGLGRRLEQLQQHHAERLEATLAAVPAGGTATAWDIAQVLFPMELDLHQQTFAFGEALAHAVHLERQGRLGSTADTAGVVRFERA